MPNPARKLRSGDMKKLSDRQKGIVKKLKKNNIPVKVYKRGDGLSVHNPFLDAQRNAKKAKRGKTKRYPHARDTPKQVKYNPEYKKRGKGLKKPPKSVLLP